MKYIYELHKTMVIRNLILVYEGEFTQEITKSVLAMAERNMDALGEGSSVKRKVFNVMVETLQNIVKYASEAEEGKEEETGNSNEETDESKSSELNHNAIFMIGKQEDKYIITSGNPVGAEKVEILRDRLEKINSLDKKGLKKHYMEVIKKSKLNAKGGAGLGFIDMARKSGQKLQFDFEPINDSISFFTLKTTISTT